MPFVATLLFVAVVACVGSALASAPADTLIVMRNGGNNTGSEPIYHAALPLAAPLDARLLERWAAKLGLTPSAQYELRDRRGALVQEAAALQPNEVVFVKAVDEQWMWPGFYIGYRVELPDVTRDNQPLVLETLALQPRLFKISSFISTQEAEHIVELAKPQLRRANVHDSGGNKASGVRTSDHAWLNSGTTPLIKTVDQRVADVTRVENLELFEHMQVVHYDGDQRYESHFDFFPPELYPGELGIPFRLGEQRTATVFYYLNDVEESAGGETVFPRAVGSNNPYLLNEKVDFRNCVRGLPVHPKRGDAILWYNVGPSGQLDQFSLHGACPLATGHTKWGANKWLRNKRVTQKEIDERRELEAQQKRKEEMPISAEDRWRAESRAIDQRKPGDSIEVNEDVPAGFQFRHTTASDNKPIVDIKRTAETALSAGVPTVTVILRANGNYDQSDESPRARLTLHCSSDKYDIGELIDVGPIALGVAEPDVPGEPCFDSQPFYAYDEHGRVVETSENLVDGAILYLLDVEEVWTWPGIHIGHRFQPETALGATLETLSLVPRLFAVDNLLSRGLVDALIAQAMPLMRLAERDEAGVAGAAGQATVQLPRESHPLAALLDERIGALLRVPMSEKDASAARRDLPLRLWRLDGEMPAWRRVEAEQRVESNPRVATLLYFVNEPGQDSTHAVFPLHNATAYEKMPHDGTLEQLCALRETSERALRVPIMANRALLLYHVDAPSMLFERYLDPRAAHVLCAHRAAGFKYVFEKAVHLYPHVEQGNNFLRFARPAPQYDAPNGRTPDAFESLQMQLDDKQQKFADVFVHRMGGNNTGGEPWRARVPLLGDESGMDALKQLAAIRLGFSQATSPADVDASAYQMRSSQGFKLTKTTKFKNGVQLYLGPKEWSWMWPSVRVGYRRQLARIPLAPDQPDDHRFVMETLSVSPRAFVIRNFLSELEINWFIKRANDTIETPMNPSAAPQSPSEPSTTWLFVVEIDDPIDILDSRIAALMRIPKSEDIYEAVVVERFKGEQYQHRPSMEAYFDSETQRFNHMPSVHDYGVNRLAGIYMILQEPKDGGDIVFPYALDGAGEPMSPNPLGNRDGYDAMCAPNSQFGMRPNLKRGDALIYYTLHADTQLKMPYPGVDRRTLQHHCAVSGGAESEKWAAFKFVHNRLDPSRGMTREQLEQDLAQRKAEDAAGDADSATAAPADTDAATKDLKDEL